jgi:hypothetical protein
MNRVRKAVSKMTSPSARIPNKTAAPLKKISVAP